MCNKTVNILSSSVKVVITTWMVIMSCIKHVCGLIDAMYE